MTPAQSKRIKGILKGVQDARRLLDKEVANGGVVGIASDFGSQVDLDDALWGILYVEKALVRIYDREDFVRSASEPTKTFLRHREKASKNR
jgi:hypothetical protein